MAHIGFKKSFDNGNSWSSIQVIWDDGANTCGNPSPVLDRKSGRISLLSTWNRGEDKEWQIIDQKSIDTRHVFLIHSNDNGSTWSNPNSKSAREKMTVKFSFDKMKTWSQNILIHDGPAAYSNLIQLNNFEIGCLFEGGLISAYEGIAFKKVNIQNLK